MSLKSDAQSPLEEFLCAAGFAATPAAGALWRSLQAQAGAHPHHLASILPRLAVEVEQISEHSSDRLFVYGEPPELLRDGPLLIAKGSHGVVAEAVPRWACSSAWAEPAWLKACVEAATPPISRLPLALTAVAPHPRVIAWMNTTPFELPLNARPPAQLLWSNPVRVGRGGAACWWPDTCRYEPLVLDVRLRRPGHEDELALSIWPRQLHRRAFSNAGPFDVFHGPLPGGWSHALLMRANQMVSRALTAVAYRPAKIASAIVAEATVTRGLEVSMLPAWVVAPALDVDAHGQDGRQKSQ